MMIPHLDCGKIVASIPSRGFYPKSGQKHPDYKSGLSGILLFLGQARTNK
jgi:hypothetical protein